MATQRVEGMGHQQQLAGGVHMGALAPLGVPGVADLDPLHRGQDVVVTA